MHVAGKTADTKKDSKPSVQRRMSVLKPRPMAVSKNDLRAMFDRNLIRNAKLVATHQKHNDLFVFLHKLEEQHGIDFSEQGLEKVILLR